MITSRDEAVGNTSTIETIKNYTVTKSKND